MKQQWERLADASALTGTVKADLWADGARTVIGELGTLNDEIPSTLVLSTGWHTHTPPKPLRRPTATGYWQRPNFNADWKGFKKDWVKTRKDGDSWKNVGLKSIRGFSKSANLLLERAERCHKEQQSNEAWTRSPRMTLNMDMWITFLRILCYLKSRTSKYFVEINAGFNSQ